MNLFIDPGLRGVGAALFDGPVLTRASYVKNPVEHGRGYFAHASLAHAVRAAYPHDVRVFIEHPRVYPGMPETDPNDLLDVVAVGSAIASQYFGAPSVEMVKTVFPSEWKGTVKKEVMTERIYKKLTPEELLCIEQCPRHLFHNVLDAVGIGLWHFRRLNHKQYPGATHADH